MERVRAVFMIMLLSMFVCTGAVHAGFGVRVSGPISYIRYGDFNEYVEEWNEFFAGSGISMDEMKWVPEFGGEVLFSVLPSFDVALGAGMILGSNEVSASLVDVELFDISHKLRAYPFTLTAYVRPPVPLGFLKPFVYAGAGLYYTKVTFENVDHFDEVNSYDAELTKTGFGLHGGAGLEFSAFPRVTIDFGVKARWAAIKGFEGTRTLADGTSGDVFLMAGPDEEGDYYYGPESNLYKSEFDEGEVDLSGFGFVIGLKVTF